MLILSRIRWEQVARARAVDKRVEIVGLTFHLPAPSQILSMLCTTERHPVNPGNYEGETCNRDGCPGVLAYPKVENCSCHISPPCVSCVENPLTCPECGWVEDRFIQNDHVVSVEKTTGVWRDHGLRPLDPTKIDWHSFSHSNSSMVKEGVYPEGTTSNQVLALVDGTFGGRFESFGNGKFKFIAYTD